MINVYIYLKEQDSATRLAKLLVQEKLAANASIDIDNTYFELIDGEVSERVNAVITVQTKGLLFNQLTDFIEAEYGLEVPIYTSPIVSTNTFFDQYIRRNTKKV